ncbi:3-dehydroquinate synthase [Tepidibacillus sp. HK-1]|uniref:3-dehydroquinate synthase n=1 Tax=Tepidibacillus sp. HK-1 TaxID=1883407 RepID=UPI0008529B8E|nr:3-dehydroquinate synthase [Tepidibacillus sp. HK-1]GBF11706.1 3-dehydroquinate synthase [Tepidibacillus sp. HK-1]
MKTIRIETTNHAYPVLIGSKIINQLSKLLIQTGISQKTKILIISDENVAPLYLQVVVDQLNKFDAISYVVPAGDVSKAIGEVEKIITYAIQHGLDRSSVILALGGGVIGDLAGFVASIYMRGIRYVQCPTTILAHDSSVGGKVGINHALGKNLIGSFYQPQFVLYDTSFLTTLPTREVRSGLVEVLKHGLIADRQFVDWLEKNADSLLHLDQEAVSYALKQGIKIKADIVMEDEKEQGIRAILNFGHTLGHVIETLSNYQYLHGEAVAIGMFFAAKLAAKLGWLSKEEEAFYQHLLQKFKCKTSIPKEYDTNQMMNIMLRDKKFKNGQIRMVLPIAIGQVKIEENIDQKFISETLNELKR